MSWRRSLAICLGLSLALSSVPLSADVWDNDPNNEDDSSSTDNELFHGAEQIHDLASAGVVDQDWYAVRSRPFSSYEALVFGVQGEVFLTEPVFDRVDGGGGVLTAGAPPPGGAGSSVSIRWANNTASLVVDYVRITGANASCGTACTTNTQYTIRFRETTGSVARFNNASGQTTVLLLQNPATYTIAGTVRLWDTAGTSVGTQAFTLPAKGLFTFNTSTVAPGVGGSITITQDGRFGDLQGKSVALEPATGFSFDTPMVYRPH